MSHNSLSKIRNEMSDITLHYEMRLLTSDSIKHLGTIEGQFSLMYSNSNSPIMFHVSCRATLHQLGQGRRAVLKNDRKVGKGLTVST